MIHFNVFIDKPYYVDFGCLGEWSASIVPYDAPASGDRFILLYWKDTNGLYNFYCGVRLISLYFENVVNQFICLMSKAVFF